MSARTDLLRLALEVEAVERHASSEWTVVDQRRIEDGFDPASVVYHTAKGDYIFEPSGLMQHFSGKGHGRPKLWKNVRDTRHAERLIEDHQRTLVASHGTSLDTVLQVLGMGHLLGPRSDQLRDPADRFYSGIAERLAAEHLKTSAIGDVVRQMMLGYGDGGLFISVHEDPKGEWVLTLGGETRELDYRNVHLVRRQLDGFLQNLERNPPVKASSMPAAPGSPGATKKPQHAPGPTKRADGLVLPEGMEDAACSGDLDWCQQQVDKIEALMRGV